MISDLSIQKLLYDHPLYDVEGDINILAYGDSDIIYSFVNYALQLGQIPNTNVAVTIASDTLGVKAHYESIVQDAFYDYICFDSKPCNKLQLGRISFLSKNDVDFSDYNYVLVATDDFLHNREFANSLDNRVVAYLSDCDYPEDKAIAVYPVSNIQDVNEQLLRMAFNVHLIWGTTDKTMQELRDDFERDYNFVSSCSNALSIKYKLHCLNLDIDNTLEQCRRIADEFADNYDDKIAKELIESEHNRWVVEKILDGWTGVEKVGKEYDLSNCVSNSDWKNSKEKIHPCIAPFSALGKISNDLNTHFARFCNNDTSIISNVEKLYSLPIDDDLLFKFRYNVESIIFGSSTASKQYGNLRNMIKYSCDGIMDDNILEKIDADIFCYNRRNEKKDFSNLDRYFIDRIPFILSYDTGIHYVARLRVNDGFADLDMLKNPLLLRPESITFVGNTEYKDEASQLLRDNNISSRLFFVNDEDDVEIDESTIINEQDFSKELCDKYSDKLISNISWINYIAKRNIKLKIDDVAKYNGIQREKNENVAILDKRCRDAIFKLYKEKPLWAWNKFVADLMGQKKHIFFEYKPELIQGMPVRAEFPVEKEWYSNLLMILTAIERVDEHFSFSFGDVIGDTRVSVSGSKDVIDKITDLICNGYHYLDSKYDIKQYACIVDRNDSSKRMLSDYVTDNRRDKTVCFVEENLFIEAMKDDAMFTRLRDANAFLQVGKTDVYKYASRAIKNIFSKEGNILENVVYTSAVESNYFDDVIPSFQLSYQNESGRTVNHEIDCVLTRGDTVLLVECKNKTNVEPNANGDSAYTQVQGATEKFKNGNIIRCIVHYDNNAQHIPSYEDTGVITINNKLFIVDGQIAKTLKNIADGSCRLDSNGVYLGT